MENMCDDHHLLLPQDVLVKILVSLPVISLLRFKSVSKSWRALIESSFFIDLHLNTLNYYSSKFGSFIFQTSGNTILDRKVNGAFMLSGCGSDNEMDEVEELNYEDLGFPQCYKDLPRLKRENNSGFLSRYHNTWMVGSCNGLICIQDTKHRDVSLWNPATRQFRLLPKPLTFVGFGDLQQDVVAFGYDVKTRDYKVVLISYYKPYMSDLWPHSEKHIFRIQLYKSSTNSWMLLDDIDYFRARPVRGFCCRHGVYLNGSYYFLGLNDLAFEGPVLLSFDFSKEIFTNIQFPPLEFPIDNFNMYLSYFNEKLAVFARNIIYIRAEPVEDYDIWVLNEHETKEPWIKLHSFTVTFSGIPRGISNNGEYALIEDHDLREINGNHVIVFYLNLFNLVRKEVKKEFITNHMVIRAYAYKQSLVSISGNGTSTTNKFNDGAMLL